MTRARRPLALAGALLAASSTVAASTALTAGAAHAERPYGAATTVKLLTADDSGMTGRLKSVDAGCVAGRKVVLHRLTAGTKQRVRTDRRGRFAFGMDDALPVEVLLVSAPPRSGCLTGWARMTTGGED